jgi:hypothetical protein
LYDVAPATADHVTVTCPPLSVAVTTPGAAGRLTGAVGVTPLDCVDGCPSPLEFAAVTWYR